MKCGAREPLVSVVLPTLNGRRYIAESIESCLAQTHRSFELIVVDDGSTDGTADIVSAFGDPRIALIRLAENVGLPGALNRGFAEARGEYFTFTSDDNLYAPEAFETLATALRQHPEAGLVYAGMHVVDAEGRVLRAGRRSPPEALGRTNPIGACFMYRRSVAEIVGDYDHRFLLAEDAHYWMRISRQSKILQLPAYCYYYRVHDESLSERRYGRYEARRVIARASGEVLGTPRSAVRRLLGAAYVDEAFAAFERHDLGHARRSLVRGAVRDPVQLTRRKVVRLALDSLRRSPPRQSAPLQSP